MGPAFGSGQKVVVVLTGKRGTVERLRDDAYERGRRCANPGHYFYSINFDDGTFDTYIAQTDLRLS